MPADFRGMCQEQDRPSGGPAPEAARSLFIDTGTTTLHLAEQIVDLPGLVIITSSLEIAARPGGNPEHQIFLAGRPAAAIRAAGTRIVTERDA